MKDACSTPPCSMCAYLHIASVRGVCCVKLDWPREALGRAPEGRARAGDGVLREGERQLRDAVVEVVLRAARDTAASAHGARHISMSSAHLPATQQCAILSTACAPGQGWRCRNVADASPAMHLRCCRWSSRAHNANHVWAAKTITHCNVCSHHIQVKHHKPNQAPAPLLSPA
jgi:hypothetical protein